MGDFIKLDGFVELVAKRFELVGGGWSLMLEGSSDIEHSVLQTLAGFIAIEDSPAPVIQEFHLH